MASKIICALWMLAIAATAHSADLDKKQQAAVVAIEKVGGKIIYDEQTKKIALVGFHRSETTDRDLVHLKALPEVEMLYLNGTGITNAGLVHLKGLPNLAWLELSETNITDAGLEHLKGLRKLGVLKLFHTKITDAGLEHLKTLPELDVLEIKSPHLTDAGVLEFRRALPSCAVVYFSWPPSIHDYLKLGTIVRFDVASAPAGDFKGKDVFRFQVKPDHIGRLVKSLNSIPADGVVTKDWPTNVKVTRITLTDDKKMTHTLLLYGGLLQAPRNKRFGFAGKEASKRASRLVGYLDAAELLHKIKAAQEKVSEEEQGSNHKEGRRAA